MGRPVNKPSILVAGHSHIRALARAWEENAGDYGAQIEFLSFRDQKFAIDGIPPRAPDTVQLEYLLAELSSLEKAADVLVLSLNGNEHNNFGLFESTTKTFSSVEENIRRSVEETSRSWLKHLFPQITTPVVLLLPPPPNESDDFILGTDRVRNFGRQLIVRPGRERLALWRSQCEVSTRVAQSFGVQVFAPPASVFSKAGFLAEECRGDLSHGNEIYGKRVLQELIEFIRTPHFEELEGKRTDRREHPYRFLPNYCFWKRSISEVASNAVDPVVSPPFKIGTNDRVATAGSCFAQHISKHLRAGGFRFLVTEAAREGGGADSEAFHDFSARYGNVYTARQLLQLFDRAFGYFRPLERVWVTTEGRFCDPFRPTIQSGGYGTKEEVLEDAQQHLLAVRKMFRQLDVFVFTLGLTECWMSQLDGAVYPMAPGVAGGEYDPEKHTFVNFGVGEVASDMQLFIKKLRTVNPKAKVILTVSPVPLAATYEDRHVLVSTTYSKSVLRVAAEELVANNDGVYYFPSYEIITGSHAAGAYFEPDRRGVTAEGVSHVMRVFMARMTEERSGKRSVDDDLEEAIEAMGEALCDEEMVAR